MKSTAQRKAAPPALPRPAYRSLQGWALGVLSEHGAITECEHGKRTEEFRKKQFGIKQSSGTKDGQIINKYETHYNANLDKCFYLTMSETIAKNKVTKVERLFSIDENKEYGMFTGGKRDNFTICVLFIRKPWQRCSSEDEWRALIKPYMKDAAD
jgi:hypothetical protein